MVRTLTHALAGASLQGIQQHATVRDQQWIYADMESIWHNSINRQKPGSLIIRSQHSKTTASWYIELKVQNSIIFKLGIVDPMQYTEFVQVHVCALR